jgi:hypothetical protein
VPRVRDAVPAGPAAAAAGRPGQQVGRKPFARTPPPDQDVHLPAGYLKVGRCRVGRVQADHPLRGEFPDHLGPADGQVPRFGRRGQYTAFFHRRFVGPPGLTAVVVHTSTGRKRP